MAPPTETPVQIRPRWEVTMSSQKPAGPDLVEHDSTGDCICGPTAQPVKRDDGSVGWIYIHHSLDGREHTEAR